MYIRAYDDGNLEVLNLTSEKIKIKNIFYSKKEDCTNCKSKIFSFKRNIKKSEFEKIYAQNFKLAFLSDE